MKQDELMNTVQEILENGGELPAKVTNKLLAGMNIHSFGVAQEAKDQAEKNDRRIFRLEVLFGSGGVLGSIGAALKFLGII